MKFSKRTLSAAALLLASPFIFAKEARAQLRYDPLSSPSLNVYGGTGALDELLVYFAWSCASNQYVLSWGYDPNTTCADESALGYFFDSKAYAAFVPLSGDSGPLSVQISNSNFSWTIWGETVTPPMWSSTPPYYFALQGTLPTAALRGIINMLDSRSGDMESYCANIVGWGSGASWWVNTQMTFSLADGASTSAWGQSQTLVLMCEW